LEAFKEIKMILPIIGVVTFSKIAITFMLGCFMAIVVLELVRFIKSKVD